jgi:hypothetical protein
LDKFHFQSLSDGVAQNVGDNFQVHQKKFDSLWYKDIVYFLQNLQAPPDFDKEKVRSLKLKVAKYCIMNQSLFWKDPGGMLLKCIDEEESHKVISEFHKGECGGHHFWKATTYKILRVGYYWPTLFTNVFSKVRACVECQIFFGKQKLKPLPLNPIVVNGPFQQWGLDFIGEIHPHQVDNTGGSSQPQTILQSG